MVEIVKETRIRTNTVRPAIDIPYEIWDEFKNKYNSKNDRNEIIVTFLEICINENNIGI